MYKKLEDCVGSKVRILWVDSNADPQQYDLLGIDPAFRMILLGNGKASSWVNIESVSRISLSQG